MVDAGSTNDKSAKSDAATPAVDGGGAPKPADAGAATTYPGCVALPSTIPAGTDAKIDAAIRHREKADIAQQLIVQLRSDLTPSLPDCPSQQTSCPERDRAALDRAQLHQQQVACVVDLVGSVSGRVWWWDEPVLLTTGEPTSRLLAFGVALLGRDVERLASHPFVAGISLPPDLKPPTDECPTAIDASAASKVDASAGAASGRSFTIVTVNRPFECSDCQDLRVQRRTHYVSTRLLTCLFQRVKRVTGEFRLLPHAGGDATFGQPDTSFQREFAVPLSAQEATEVARDPYVRSIVLTNAPITSPNEPMDDLNEGPCPDARESVAGKISNEDELRKPGAHPCLIGVKGGGDASALNVTCPSGRECPERTAALDRVLAAHRQSQRCVRAFLDELGASYSDEVLWGNAFSAQLTFEQAMRIAAHPHVLSISVDVPTPPP